MKALPLLSAAPAGLPGMTVHLCGQGETCRCTVRSIRYMRGYFIFSCNEITDRDRAALFRGALLGVPPDTLPSLGEGEYLREEVVGRRVVSADGEELGTIADIFATPAHDVYVVAQGEKEYLIPAVREFILEVPRNGNTIVVRKMEGMFD